MGDAAAYSYIAMQQAIADRCLRWCVECQHCCEC
jgi:hypothetical protein